MSTKVEDERILLVVARKGAYAIGTEELVFIEKVPQDAFHLLLVADRK